MLKRFFQIEFYVNDFWSVCRLTLLRAGLSRAMPDGECGIAKIYKNKDVRTNHFNCETGREK